MKTYKFFPKKLPHVIVLFVLFYIFVAATLGILFYQGNQSPKVLNAARFFPIPVAKVDGQFIWARKFIEYRSFMENFIARSSEAGEALSLEQSLDRQVVDMLVQNFIINKIADDFDISISAAEIDEAYKNLLILENGEGPSEEVSEEELQTILEELYGSDSFRLKEFIGITLLENKIKSNVIEQVKFRHILVATEKEATSLISELKDNKDFAALAKEFSKDASTRNRGGEVGFVSRADLEDEALQEALFGNGVGLLEDSVKAKDGFHVIEILEKKGSVPGTFTQLVQTYRTRLGVDILIPLD